MNPPKQKDPVVGMWCVFDTDSDHYQAGQVVGCTNECYLIRIENLKSKYKTLPDEYRLFHLSQMVTDYIHAIGPQGGFVLFKTETDFRRYLKWANTCTDDKPKIVELKREIETK